MKYTKIEPMTKEEIDEKFKVMSTKLAQITETSSFQELALWYEALAQELGIVDATLAAGGVPQPARYAKQNKLFVLAKLAMYESHCIACPDGDTCIVSSILKNEIDYEILTHENLYGEKIELPKVTKESIQANARIVKENLKNKPTSSTENPFISGFKHDSFASKEVLDKKKLN